MKTSVMDVHDMLSVFSVDEVEKRIGEVPGVESVTVNFAAGNATVRFDETRLENADIKAAVRQRGYVSAAPGAGAAAETHEGHEPAGGPPGTAQPVASTATPVAPAAASSAPPDTASAPAAPDPPAGEPAAAGVESKDNAAPKDS
jgi:copper chaperone CopZ